MAFSRMSKTLVPAALSVLALLSGLALTAGESSAGAPINVMRTQSNVVRSAIKRNIDIIIRPRLVVAKGATGPVSTLTLSPDEKFLLTAVGDNSLRLWDLGVGREAAVLTGHGAKITAVAVSLDGRSAASADASGQVRLWDLKNPQDSKILPLSMTGVSRLAFAGKGERLLLAGTSGEVTIWDLASGRETARVPAHSGGVLALAVSPDGASFLTAGADGKVRSFDAATGAARQGFKSPSGQVLSLSLAPGLGLAAGGGSKGEAFLWNLSDGSLMKKFEAHDGPVSGVSLNEGTGLLATGGGKGEVKVWNARTGAAVKILGRHDGTVNFVQVDREGTHVLSASEDGTTRLWNILGGNLLVTMISTSDGWAIVDAQGRFDGNQAALAGIEWQDGGTRLPVSNFSELYYEPTLLPKLKSQPQALAGVKAIPEGIHLPPKVDIEPGQDGDGKSRNVVKVRVRGEDQGGSGVEEVRLYQNGKLVSEHTAAPPEVVTDEAGVVEMVRRYDLSLAPGDNLLAAVAVNKERLESPPSTVMVKGGEAAAPTLHLLTVGINKYRNPAMNLDYAEVDARSIKDFFTSAKSFPFSKAQVAHLSDQQATKPGILGLFANVHKVPAQDIVVVYMAGHGIGLDDEWYFVPYELEDPESAQVKALGLSSRELKQAVESISANRVFMVIDACHSGGAVSPIKDFQGMKALRMLARNSGVHVLSATDKNQFAVELSELGHGVFTYSLLKGLAGEADRSRDGQISVEETMVFVEKMVPLISQRYAQYLQYPTAHSRGFDFGLVNAR